MLLTAVAFSFTLAFTLACQSPQKSEPQQPIENSYPERYVYKILGHTPGGLVRVGSVFKMHYRDRLLLITAAHVCEVFSHEYGPKPVIETEFGYITVNILAQKPEADICMLETPHELLRNKIGLRIGHANPVEGQTLKTFGFPRVEYKIIVRGKYLGRTNVIMPENILNGYEVGVLDYPAIGGQSGSPILNLKNEVVGILIISFSMKTGFVPLHEIYRFLMDEVQKK
jgi:hypothetical protein